MKGAKKKEMTIEDLAIMVGNGFSAIDRKFTDKFNAIDFRLVGVETRLMTVEELVKNTRRDVLNIGDKFIHRHEFDTLLTRVLRIEEKVEGKHK